MNESTQSKLERARREIINALPSHAASHFLREINRLQRSGVFGEIEQAKALLEKVKPASFYESLSAEARQGYDYSTGRRRPELKVIPHPVKVMSIPEQLERLEKLVERVEKLNEKVNGENYAENENEYEH